MRAPIFRGYHALPGELVIDNFAGGGGASTGIEAALNRPVDIAINHSAEALALHQANHPETKHFCEDIWAVDPKVACGSRPVGLAWFSPNCTHFSRAKGSKPLDRKIRGLAWVVIRWAKAVQPRVICLENVEEFESWGNLDDNDRPDPKHVGDTFRAWLAKLIDLGYKVEFKTLIAADYGTPTTRKRLFLIARRDGGPIVWPTPTHGKGRPNAWRPAADVIDWTLPCPSIFDRVRPLADATMRRIATGIEKHVIRAANPFIVPNLPRDLLMSPTLIQTGYGEREGQAPRVPGLHKPLGTVVSGGKHALVAAMLTKHFGGPNGYQNSGSAMTNPMGTVTAVDHHALTVACLAKFYGTSSAVSVEEPLPTVTAGGTHLAEVRAFLMKYYSGGEGGRPQQQELFEPLHTVTTKARFGLVMVHGAPYRIVDIGMRMLSPRELFDAQGFPEDYDITPMFNGKPLTKTAQTSLAGNSVCPQVAEALVRQATAERSAA